MLIRLLFEQATERACFRTALFVVWQRREFILNKEAHYIQWMRWVQKQCFILRYNWAEEQVIIASAFIRNQIKIEIFRKF